MGCLPTVPGELAPFLVTVSTRAQLYANPGLPVLHRPVDISFGSSSVEGDLSDLDPMSGSEGLPFDIGE